MAIGFHNQLLDLAIGILASILFIYSFVETRKGYVILEIKNSQLIICNPFNPFSGKTEIMIDNIYEIQQEISKKSLVFNIYTKDEILIPYSMPVYLYNTNPLSENSHLQLKLQKEIRQFFKEISDYLEQKHEKELQ